MQRRFFLLLTAAALLLCAAAPLAFYSLYPDRTRVRDFVSDSWLKVYRRFYPPEEVLFIPQDQVQAIVQATLQALTPTPFPSSTSTPVILEQPDTATPTLPPELTPTPTLSPSPTSTATPLPEEVRLRGVKNEIETRNNCGPATISMALSYYGWTGNQAVARAVLRPNLDVDDKNVMPAELVDYVQNYTGMRALVRVGGDVEMLKRLIAAGYPVIIEKGHTTTGWIGHYILLTGYNDQRRVFYSQDSLITAPDTPVPYDELRPWWRHFNYLYLVVFSPDHEARVLELLGEHAVPADNFRYASEKAMQEISELKGRPLFFAWFNLGASLVGLEDYASAALAYDTAYSQVYATIPKDDRPWRVLWYQDGPYRAYYATGRYQDVVNLADATLRAIGNPVLEESFYWRGMARLALGDPAGAQADFQKAVELNPDSTPARQMLQSP